MAQFTLTINGQKQQVDVDPATPMLWVLRDHLKLVGTKYGCGIAQCGACTIHVGEVHRGVSAYFCHNSYVATIVDMVKKNGKPVIQNVLATVDCGIVVNPDAATNLVEGGLVDGIGNAMYGELTFKEGQPKQSNFVKGA